MLPRARKLALVSAAILYLIAGILHLSYPGSYVKIVPPFVPAPLAMVFVSGIAEIAGGIGLLVPSLRRAAAWGLVALLIAIFPANVYMAMEHVQVGTKAIPGILLWLRLPLQGVLIWWVLWSVGGTLHQPGPNEANQATGNG